ncbi:uncharacterized protein LOC117895449 [Drosophila subobscura]|uniref:uncharacterized protein LOC117895449 n=1 Tax=Drosophila subobscura TaxID=7241 RepID=UPI00155A4601|nr:uncharacterized protein LOC117895449 [Drosophila subobscura]
MKFVLLCTLLLSIALIMASAQFEGEDPELYPQHHDHHDHRDRLVRSLTPEEMAKFDKSKGDVVGCCG